MAILAMNFAGRVVSREFTTHRPWARPSQVHGQDGPCHILRRGRAGVNACRAAVAGVRGEPYPFDVRFSGLKTMVFRRIHTPLAVGGNLAALLILGVGFPTARPRRRRR